jgi:hypothetical protein
LEFVAVQPVKSPVSKPPFFTRSSEACKNGRVPNARMSSNGKTRSFCVAETGVSHTHHSSVLGRLKKLSKQNFTCSNSPSSRLAHIETCGGSTYHWGLGGLAPPDDSLLVEAADDIRPMLGGTPVGTSNTSAALPTGE